MLCHQGAFWRDLPSSLLLEPTDYRSSAWSEHVPFAFWIVEALRPKQLVELGTWYGMSYLAFCQAFDEFKVDGRSFAVDTWKGDEHTGPIAEEALASLKKDHDPKYARFSALLRTTFDQAVTKFEDGSIDLLHVDGLHTYAAVKHDFETWLPKLSDRAVVLFHDTQVFDRSFGVHELWAELRRKYRGFEFKHEHGLGVLGVGANQQPVLEALYAADQDAGDARLVRQIFERLGRSVRVRQDLMELQSKWDGLKANAGVRAALKARDFASSAFRRS
jgi:hypothetical protein